MKLAAEIEFLPQEIWNKMRDKSLVDLITRTLSFSPAVSSLTNVFCVGKKQCGCASHAARAALWSETLARVVHSRSSWAWQEVQKDSCSFQFPSQLPLLSS